ncbi:unnamed protein product, partial [marine sediment metagenome]
MSTVHSTLVFAFENKTKTNFVDGESSYLAEYDDFVVAEPWTLVVFARYDSFVVFWLLTNFFTGAIILVACERKLSSQRNFPSLTCPGPAVAEKTW